MDQHASWIAVNPIQGCPKACGYCFLHERGQAAVHPEFLATPVEAVALLLDSPFYDSSRPVALYTWTDVMALPASRDHLAEMLAELGRRRVPNPVVLITKCHIPDATIATIDQARGHGLTVLVYLSYSGLDRRVERGIRHGQLAENFPRLDAAGIPIVHYWRPALPESATTETMQRVLAWAAAHATCTVAAGLKVEAAALRRLSGLWSALLTTDGVSEAEGVYPRAFWEFIHRSWQQHPHHPVFHTNSCALAYVLGRPDQDGVFGGTVCLLRNTCPIVQRARCGEADTLWSPPSIDSVRGALGRRGLADAPFTLSRDGRELVVEEVVPNNIVAALTHDLGVRVRAILDGADTYWSSGTAGAVPVIVE